MAGLVEVESPATISDFDSRIEARVVETSRKTRRVLMISCAFPPTGGPGVQRSAKFAKYLGEFGWKPTVWAVDQLADLPVDESLLADLPDDLDVRRRSCRSAIGGDGCTNEGLLGSLRWRFDRMVGRMLAAMIPDPMILWALRSYRPALRLIREEKIDVIYSTFSPASNHVLGWLLKKRTGLPWVADFRDLWTDDYCYGATGRRRSIERRMEQGMLEAADAVVATTDHQRDILSKRVKGGESKFVSVTNGVDTDDFDRVDRAEARDRLHGPVDQFLLVFTGWFLSDRVDEGLIEGIGRFAEHCRANGSEFEFRVVGAISKKMVGRFDDRGVKVTTTGYLPHEEAVEHAVSGDVLLLCGPSGRNGGTLVPAKLYEYFAAGRPVLAVGPVDSISSRRVVEADAGVVVESDPDAVCGALVEFHRQFRAGEMVEGCSAEKLAPFTRRGLTGQLAEVLDQACQSD